jgi:hypothetical protein
MVSTLNLLMPTTKEGKMNVGYNKIKNNFNI